MDIDFDLNIQGNLTEDELNAVMTVLGELILAEIKKNIRKMDLIGKGFLLQHWVTSWDGKMLRIENTEHFSDFLEFGTFSYWNMNGLDNYTEQSDPKKKDMTRKQRAAFPKGCQSFGFIRKVLYNNQLMEKLVNTAFSSQLS